MPPDIPDRFPAKILVQVECYAGYRGEETPKRLRFGRRTIEIRKVLDRWLAPEHRYFKLMGADDAVYIVRHEESAGTWELTFFTEPDDRP